MLHVSHYRPDAITRTSVIEPWNIQKRNPVAMADKILSMFTRNFTMPGPGMTQHGDTTMPGVLPGSSGGGAAGPQRGALSGVPQGPFGPAAPGHPRDGNLRPIQQQTVMQDPMHGIYRAMIAQRQAFATGSIWDQIRAQTRVDRHSGVKLPFVRF